MVLILSLLLSLAEGPPIDGSVVVDSVHCNNAVEWLPETKALMLAVEHRYYGCHNMSACPVESFANQRTALRYLSSRQALADLAGFHVYAVQRWGLTDKNRWVSWGGQGIFILCATPTDVSKSKCLYFHIAVLIPFYCENEKQPCSSLCHVC